MDRDRDAASHSLQESRSVLPDWVDLLLGSPDLVTSRDNQGKSGEEQSKTAQWSTGGRPGSTHVWYRVKVVYVKLEPVGMA